MCKYFIYNFGAFDYKLFTEDPDIRLARILSIEELSMEIQTILHCVNQTFASRNQTLVDEFVGLQEAIQATLQVHSKLF